MSIKLDWAVSYFDPWSVEWRHRKSSPYGFCCCGVCRHVRQMKRRMKRRNKRQGYKQVSWCWEEAEEKGWQ